MTLFSPFQMFNYFQLSGEKNYNHSAKIFLFCKNNFTLSEQGRRHCSLTPNLAAVAHLRMTTQWLKYNKDIQLALNESRFPPCIENSLFIIVFCSFEQQTSYFLGSISSNTRLHLIEPNMPNRLILRHCKSAYYYFLPSPLYIIIVLTCLK